MTSHYPSEPESGPSTPRSDHQPHPQEPTVRLMCSFGGRILPRPHDNQLRYVGGDTRIVAIQRSTTFAALQSKLSKLSNSSSSDVSLKYQLPNEDLDALISVTTDEDVENMMEEYDRIAHQSTNSKTARLRLFLFPTENSEGEGLGSLLGGSSKRESWFLDALNGRGLERGRSEASSIISEVPDYLFGLDNSEDSKLAKNRPVLSENVSVMSDPGSPAPPITSPYFSTSSPLPDLPPVRIRVENQVETQPTQMGGDPVQPARQPSGFAPNPVWHYIQDPNMHGPGMQQMPVYYVPAGQVPARPVTMHVPYGHQVGPAVSAPAQIQVGLPHPVPGQVYGPGYEYSVGVGHDGVAQQQQVYYTAARNAGAYPTSAIPGEMQGGGSKEMKMGRVSGHIERV
eukprot:TRINITY_DN4625_c0_g1_i1.p1 TRINITY_DN4625_c0_g1~~TRINITY_DN4625_c0_g1_i1.p1  ORF type:complete len:398 (+),score=52.61 TRINITY_DN4625_c0_g1_i1:1184-2377(+)